MLLKVTFTVLGKCWKDHKYIIFLYDLLFALLVSELLYLGLYKYVI